MRYLKTLLGSRSSVSNDAAIAEYNKIYKDIDKLFNSINDTHSSIYISDFDRKCYIAVCALYNIGCNSFWLEQVSSILNTGQKNNFSDSWNINSSLEKFREGKVFIEEGSFTIVETFLSFTKVVRRNCVEVVCLKSEPVLSIIAGVVRYGDT